jgi:hypothetical protein
LFADASDEDSPIFGRREFLEVAAGAYRELLFKLMVFVVVCFFVCVFFFLNVVPWSVEGRQIGEEKDGAKPYLIIVF